MNLNNNETIDVSFDEILERRNTRSQKWDSQEEYRNGSVIPMWVADMDLPIAPVIMDAIRRRAKHPVFGYVDDRGDIAKSASRWVRIRHGWEIGAECITFSPGIVPAISAVVQSFTSPGDPIIIQSPVYYPFEGTILSCGRKVVKNPLKCENGFYSMDYADLERKITETGAKLLIFCNPHNPVGRVYTEEELNRLSEICIRHQVMVFSDEIHSDLIMRGYRHIPLAAISKEMSTLCMTGIAPSKTFNLAGMQTGVVISENPEYLAKFREFLQRNAMHFPNTFGTEACITAYSQGERYLESLLDYLQGNYSYFASFMEEKLPEIRFSPLQGTYLVWMDFRSMNLTDEQLDDFIRQDAGLGLDSGYWFGEEGKGFMRMNIACPRKRLAEALNQLYSAINHLEKEKDRGK